MSDLLTRLDSGERLLSDGAMGSMLMARGLKAGDCPERFNLEQPDILKEIARVYLEAGADIIHTNTFGGSPIKLTQYDLQNRASEINSRAVEAVRGVVDDKVLISASFGPSGKMLKPYGELDPDQLTESFVIQAKSLVEAGVDLFTIETMTDLAEALVALKAVRSVSESIPVFVTMTFDKTPKGFFTMMGNRIEEINTGLTEAGANGIGSNCGNGIENMVLIAQEFMIVAKVPVIIQSNAGLPELKENQLSYPETPEFMAEGATRLLESGVKIIGGCCGTTPEHIKAMRQAIDSYSA